MSGAGPMAEPDRWIAALDRIQAEREHAEKIRRYLQARRAAIKREAELAAIRGLMRPG